MYSSLRPWCRFPVKVYRYTGMTGSGDAQYEEPVEHNGYPVEMTEMIEDKNGVQYLSKLRVYFPEEVPINVQDLVELPDDLNNRRQIRKLGGFYDGNTGKRDIWVVYL